jgi:hypothetical protein
LDSSISGHLSYTYAIEAALNFREDVGVTLTHNSAMGKWNKIG